MKFKRWRLSAPLPLVNAASALVLTLAMASCGQSKDTTEPTVERAAEPNGEVGPPERELRAVWSTTPLAGPIADIALSTGSNAMLAVAYEQSGLEMFNLEGERIAEVAPYRVAAVTSGQAAEIDGAEVTVFPGIGNDGRLKAYVYGDGLVAPVEIELPIETSAAVTGLCAAPSAGGLFRLAFWTSSTPERLMVGTVSAEEQEFTWSADAPLENGVPIGACAFDDGTPRAAGPAAASTAMFVRDDLRALVTVNREGELFVASGEEAAEQYSVREGLTVSVPEMPKAVAALGKPIAGGYPGGLIVIAGETESDRHQAVFIDTSALIDGD